MSQISFVFYNSRIKGEDLVSKINYRPQWLRSLSVLRQWFCCCLFIVSCCPHYLWGIVFGLRFVLQNFCRLLYFCCVLNVMTLLSSFEFFSWCMGWTAVCDYDIPWSYSIIFQRVFIWIVKALRHFVGFTKNNFTKVIQTKQQQNQRLRIEDTSRYRHSVHICGMGLT